MLALDISNGVLLIISIPPPLYLTEYNIHDVVGGTLRIYLLAAKGGVFNFHWLKG